ncbi:MAG TPA: hypothetical protein VF209_02315 [Patescibacteria group bacterium]
MLRLRRPQPFWHRTRILFYLVITLSILLILTGSIIYIALLESADAEHYCSYNKNVIDGLALSPEACVRLYKQTNHTFWII